MELRCMRDRITYAYITSIAYDINGQNSELPISSKTFIPHVFRYSLDLL